MTRLRLLFTVIAAADSCSILPTTYCQSIKLLQFHNVRDAKSLVAWVSLFPGFGAVGLRTSTAKTGCASWTRVCAGSCAESVISRSGFGQDCLCDICSGALPPRRKPVSSPPSCLSTLTRMSPMWDGYTPEPDISLCIGGWAIGRFLLQF